MSSPLNIRYLISAEMDAAWGLAATTAGNQQIEPGTPYPASGDHPRRYLFSPNKGRVFQEYQLVYILKGEGWFVSSHCKRMEIGPGSLFLLFPGEWHNYAPNPETGWHELWVGFTGEDMDKRVRANFFSLDKPVFNVGILDEAVGYFNQIVTAAREQKACYQQTIAGLINMLLGIVYSSNKRLEFQDIEVVNQINRAKMFMQDKLEGKLSAEEVAVAVGMGYSRFRKVFREYTGFAPAQYLQELKTSKSKELLTNTPMTCQEIAYLLGFESPSYFNVAFRRKTGMTPNDYREMTQGKKLYGALHYLDR